MKPCPQISRNRIGGPTSALVLAGFLSLCPESAPAQEGPVILTDSAFSNQAPPETSKQVFQCRPGPWGDLEYYYTFLEAPNSLIELFDVPSQQTVWRFMGMNAGEVRTLIRESGAPEVLQTALTEHSIWYEMDAETRVHPMAESVFSMPTAARQRIYAVLRRWEENRFYRAPVVIDSGDVRKFFAGSTRSEEVLAAIEKTAYPLGDALAFSDVPLVLGLVESDAEERRLLKALTRTRTLILRLRISPESNLKSLAEYWTAGFKHKDVLPILESILRTRGVERIDVAHLLPPTPRQHLYTFPPLSAGLTGRFPDSFWTSLNFFEFWPKDQFRDPGVADAFVRENYEPVQPPYGFGDVIFLSNPETGRAFHSCVYIADDIVYTKNGESLLRPWIFMKYEDLLARNRGDGALRVDAWRRIKGTGVPGVPRAAPAP